MSLGPTDLADAFSDFVTLLGRAVGQSLDDVAPPVLHAAKTPIRIVLVGETSAGKSSLLNRMLVYDGLLYESPEEATAVPIVVRYGKQARLIAVKEGAPDEVQEGPVTPADGRLTQETRDFFRSLVKHKGSRRGAASRNVKRIELELPEDGLREAGVEFVDLPGTNALVGCSGAVHPFPQDPDGCVFVLDARNAGKSTEAEQIRSIPRDLPVVFVANKMDRACKPAGIDCDDTPPEQAIIGSSGIVWQ